MFPIGLLLLFLKNYIIMGYQACTELFVPSEGPFCYVFPCELRGPARAVDRCNHCISQSAVGFPKTSSQTQPKQKVETMKCRLMYGLVGIFLSPYKLSFSIYSWKFCLLKLESLIGSFQQDTTKGRGCHDDESGLGAVDHGHCGEDEHDDHMEEEKEEKKSLKARLQAVQEVTALVQVGDLNGLRSSHEIEEISYSFTRWYSTNQISSSYICHVWKRFHMHNQSSQSDRSRLGSGLDWLLF